MRGSPVGILLVLLVACHEGTFRAAALCAEVTQLSQDDLDFFEKKVRPLFVEHCHECHSRNTKQLRGGLLLDSRDGWMKGGDSGQAILPGEPNQSLLMSAVRHESYEMPPAGKLPDALIGVLEQWILGGAPDPRTADAAPERAATDIDSGREHWAFQPTRRASVPRVEDANWPVNPLDHFILARQETRGIHPVSDAPRTALLRRVYFDLIGLPPSVDDVQRFLADTSPDALSRVVDRLLASQEFGRHWGRHWLDVARYADSNGLDENCTHFNAWRYRNWVIDAVNHDKPFDQFIKEQIAGDLMGSESQDERDQRLIATGFLVLGPKPLIDSDKHRLKMEVVDEQINTVGRAFLGLNVGCARCHDHKFDPIPTVDYYALAGIFASTTTVDGEVLNMSGWSLRPLGSDGETKYALYKEKHAAKFSELLNSRMRAGKSLGRLRTMVEQLKSEERSDKLSNMLRDAEAKYRDVEKDLESFKQHAPRLAMAVRDAEQPENAAICIRGDPHNTGKVVERGFLQVLSRDHDSARINPEQSGRLELAEWIASPDNPLTARVAVNRIWQHLFGAGLVRTVDDFGVRGDRPTHPELLDYLARRFIDEGWSRKRLIREIVTSRTYRLGTGHCEDSNIVDPENQLLWRMNRRRLNAEALRDAMLAISGASDLSAAESVVDHLWFQATGIGVDPIPRRESLRRGVFLPILRNSLPDVLEIFDFADPQVSTGRRDATTVATQSLFLLNSPFVRDAARRTAEQLLDQSPASSNRRLIVRAYRRVLGRPPASDELSFSEALLSSLYRSQKASHADDRAKVSSLALLCQALFVSTQFQFLD